jgi:hypothetical protein
MDDPSALADRYNVEPPSSRSFSRVCVEAVRAAMAKAMY